MKIIKKHKLFFVYLILFLVVATVDILNFDRFLYKDICEAVSSVSGSPCPSYYDLPIWQVYLSLAILAALYHVHGEVRITNRHLSSGKR